MPANALAPYQVSKIGSPLKWQIIKVIKAIKLKNTKNAIVG
jgi:hypothetical protein